MVRVKIGFENGDSLVTRFNGTLEEARSYYLGHVFNLGVADDNMQRCSTVERIPSLQEVLTAWAAVDGMMVVITDGTVSRRVVSVAMDGEELRVTADGWDHPVWLPMEDDCQLSGWKVEQHGNSLYIMPGNITLHVSHE